MARLTTRPIEENIIKAELVDEIYNQLGFEKFVLLYLRVSGFNCTEISQMPVYGCSKQNIAGRLMKIKKGIGIETS